MSLAWEARRRREGGSEVSAVRIGRPGGGGFGWAAHLRDWVILEWDRPAKARVLRGDGEDGVWRNLRASLMTYLPVKPEAPNITTSYLGFRFT